MMLQELNVPQKFVRNHPSIGSAGVIRTGRLLIERTIAACGLKSLADSSVLDVGCGTRFTTTIINKRIPIKSYTGVDVDASVIEFLKADVEARDERFDYAHWDVVNALYNKNGRGGFDSQSVLPLGRDRTFDLIWMFSVITHQYPEDSASLFSILSKYARPDGRLFFTAFIDPRVDKFFDLLNDQPLMMAYYQLEYLLELLDNAGWKVDLSLPPDTDNNPPLHQNCFLCSLK